MKYFILSLATLITFALFGQEEAPVYFNKTYKENIKTVLFHPKNYPLSAPILPLRSCDNIEVMSKLVLSFDDLSEDEDTDYYYTIIHCNADWKPSDLADMEYIDGFSSEEIQDFDNAFNTNVPFLNYTLELPNQDLCFNKSGNYILKVYANEDVEDIVLTRRFSVVDQKVSITPRVTRTSENIKIRTHQAINFNISYKGMDVKNPRSEFKVTVLQNDRWDLAIENVEPKFIRAPNLDYSYLSKIVFPAGKEFRVLDTRTLSMMSEQVESIVEENDEYYITLFPEPIRAAETYLFYKDINGKFIIDNEVQNILPNISQPLFGNARNNNNTEEEIAENTINDFFQQNLPDENQRLIAQDLLQNNLESDYVNVTFTLEANRPYRNGNLYVMGAFSDYSQEEQYRMHYNDDLRAYQLTLKLKQGFYNYFYGFVKEGKQLPDFSVTEGNWYEAENQYQILVYYRPLGSRYDQLIGFSTFNSSQGIF